MKCSACGYDNDDLPNDFITIIGLQSGPMHYALENDGFSTRAVTVGISCDAYACPRCGIIKIKI